MIQNGEGVTRFNLFSIRLWKLWLLLEVGGRLQESSQDKRMFEASVWLTDWFVSSIQEGRRGREILGKNVHAPAKVITG